MSRLSLRFFVMLLAASALAGCVTTDRADVPPIQLTRPTGNKAPPEYTISKQIRYTYTLRNKTERLLPKAEFWTYAPVPQTSHQWVEKIAASQPYRTSRDALGNEILHFEFENLPPYAAKIVSITVDLKIAERAAATSEGDLVRFKRPEPYIESDDGRVVGLAKELRRPTPVDSMRVAYDWIAANVKSETYIPEDRGALYALMYRLGDCTEFAYLLTALGRASEVPSRPIGGYVFKGNAIVKAVDYHNWAEFFVDGRWQIADAHKRSFMSDEADYVAMRVIAAGGGGPLGESHRYSYAGEGLEVVMN